MNDIDARGAGRRGHGHIWTSPVSALASAPSASWGSIVAWSRYLFELPASTAECLAGKGCRSSDSIGAITSRHSNTQQCQHRRFSCHHTLVRHNTSSECSSASRAERRDRRRHSGTAQSAQLTPQTSQRKTEMQNGKQYRKTTTQTKNETKGGAGRGSGA
eukprot:912211-Rhodomonas_salina.1